MGTLNSYQRFIEAAEQAGLHYTEYEAGKRAQVQTPGHSDQDRGTSITHNGQQLLVYCHNGDTEDVLSELGLTMRDLFDSPTGARYDYGDGRVVRRSFAKEFFQSGNTKGTELYGLDSLNRTGPVYVVEGEKDAQTAIHVCGVAAVSQAQGASTSPQKADWAPLKGRDVIIIADNDEPGMKRAENVQAHLLMPSARPKSITIVKAATGKDLSDHVAAGCSLDELQQVGETISRRRVKLVSANEVKTEKVDWLIDQWIPKRMLTLLAGREGIGKSTIACSWVAEFSQRGMKCAYLNSEDSRELTVKPRLQAAGANLDNVMFIDVVTDSGASGHLTLPQDTSILFEELAAHGVQFVVLDAAKSTMDPKLNGYKDDDVRQFLEPLAAAADRHGITIVGLAHFGKAEGRDTGRLMLGSIAWSQIARSVLSAARDEHGTLIVTNTKANLARDIISREAAIVSRPVKLDDGTITELGAVEWGGFTNTSAVELLDRKEDDDERGEIEAVVFDYLESQGGSAPANEVLKVTRAAGLSDNAVKKARKRIGVSTERRGFGKGASWHWTIEHPIDSSIDSIDSHTQKQAPMESMGESMGTNDVDDSGETPSRPDSDSSPEAAAPGWSAEIVSQVLNVLHPEFGQTVRTLKGSFTAGQLAKIGDLEQLLAQLESDGIVLSDGKGKFTRKQKAA